MYINKCNITNKIDILMSLAKLAQRLFCFKKMGGNNQKRIAIEQALTLKCDVTKSNSHQDLIQIKFT